MPHLYNNKIQIPLPLWNGSPLLKHLRQVGRVFCNNNNSRKITIQFLWDFYSVWRPFKTYKTDKLINFLCKNSHFILILLRPSIGGDIARKPSLISQIKFPFLIFDNRKFAISIILNIKKNYPALNKSFGKHLFLMNFYEKSSSHMKDFFLFSWMHYLMFELRINDYHWFLFFTTKKNNFWSYIFHIKIHNNYQANFPIKLSHQLSIFSTLGRQSYLPEQFRQISLYICSQYLSRLCFAFPDFFSRFSATRLSGCRRII